ncbi:MAG: sulfotransferase [Acidimicrobiales bacterium]|nr:sulfotransferase [Acidimicrobiales bacterium]
MSGGGSRELVAQPVLFIGGMGRSGTTVIERLLNEVPRLLAVGESVNLWKRGVRDGERCGCGEPFLSCPHWSAVGESAFGGWETVDVHRMVDASLSVDRTRRTPGLLLRRDPGSLSADQLWYLDHVVRVLRAAGSCAGPGTVVMDSTKHISTAALVTIDPRLDVRVLHVVRDPRGVANSRTRAKPRPEAGNVAMSTRDPKVTAARWVTDNLGFELLARRGVPTLTVRYEDVIADPETQLRRIASFAGVDTSPGDFDFVSGRTARFSTPMHSAAGNPMRFDGDVLELREDTGWRNELSAGQRRAITMITAPLLGRYGYRFRP